MKKIIDTLRKAYLFRLVFVISALGYFIVAGIKTCRTIDQADHIGDKTLYANLIYICVIIVFGIYQSVHLLRRQIDKTKRGGSQ